MPELVYWFLVIVFAIIWIAFPFRVLNRAEAILAELREIKSRLPEPQQIPEERSE